MLQLTIGNVTDRIVVTLEEKRTIANANYLFVFKSVTIGVSVVKFVLLNTSDLSPFKTRYNEFVVNTNTFFTKQGQYIYNVYEQASASNLNEARLNLLETGKAILNPQTPFVFTANKPITTFQTYGG